MSLIKNILLKNKKSSNIVIETENYKIIEEGFMRPNQVNLLKSEGYSIEEHKEIEFDIALSDVRIRKVVFEGEEMFKKGSKFILDQNIWDSNFISSFRLPVEKSVSVLLKSEVDIILRLFKSNFGFGYSRSIEDYNKISQATNFNLNEIIIFYFKFSPFSFDMEDNKFNIEGNKKIIYTFDADSQALKIKRGKE